MKKNKPNIHVGVGTLMESRDYSWPLAIFRAISKVATKIVWMAYQITAIDRPNLFSYLHPGTAI